MSKRAQRRERQQERRKKTVRDCCIALAFAAAMIALGVFGLVTNSSDLREYQGSTDVRNVDARVMEVAVHQDKTKTGGLPAYYYDAQLRFVVDDVAYGGTKTFWREVQVGNRVEVEVYRRSDGTYRIPTLTDGTQGTLANLPMYLALGAGAIVGVAAVAVLVGALRKKP